MVEKAEKKENPKVSEEKTVKKILRYNAIFDPNPKGGFVITVPKLPGLVVEADTFEDGQKLAKQAINKYLETLQKEGKAIPSPFERSFTTPIDVVFPESIRKKPNRSVFFAIIALVILAVFGATAYYLYQTKTQSQNTVSTPIPSQSPEGKNTQEDPTADWKLRTEDTLKISYKYPPTWKEETQEGDTLIVSEDGNTKIKIVGIENTDNSTTKDALHIYLEKFTDYKDQGVEYMDEGEIILDGQTGWQAHIKSKASGQEDKIFLVVDRNNPKMFQGLWITNVSDSTLPLANQIFTTFRFTN